MSYPKKMRVSDPHSRSFGTIVQFSRRGSGVVISVQGERSTYQVGYHSDGWAMDCFEDIEKLFPKKMRSIGPNRGMIVDFSEPKDGVIVKLPDNNVGFFIYEIGQRETSWTMSLFEDFDYEEAPKAFPKIMCIKEEGHSCEGLTVLFSAEKVGTVLHPGNSRNKIGDRSDQFIMEPFKDIDYKFRISNELIHPPIRLRADSAPNLPENVTFRDFNSFFERMFPSAPIAVSPEPEHLNEDEDCSSEFEEDNPF